MAEDKSVLKDKAKTAGTKQKRSGSKVVKFIKETLVELKKVVWPSKKQLITNTAVVIIISILMAFFITGIDIALSSVEKLILKQ